MALFNDGPINQQQDLAGYENGILDLANTEQIDLDGKSALAQREIGTQLLAVLLRQETRSPYTNWIDPQDMLRRQFGMSDVVVTDPLQQWHAVRTLAAVYRDAYNNQINDRYLKKWQEYLALEQDAREVLLFQIGIGISGYFLPVPPAPRLTFQPGAGAATQYFAAMTWVNQSGQESAPGAQTQIATQPGTQLVVIPPPAVPQYATGWNIYVGSTPSSLSLQNSAPLLLGAEWTMPGALAVGQAPGTGQAPDYYVTDDHVIQRG